MSQQDIETEVAKVTLRYAKARADIMASLATAVSALTGLGVVAAVLGLIALFRVIF